jgi:Zn finger protein HypA/HybF involved in hydrogenase expression
MKCKKCKLEMITKGFKEYNQRHECPKCKKIIEGDGNTQ